MIYPAYLKVAKNTVYLFLSATISNVCLFASNIILANFLSTQIYGMVILVVSISSIYIFLADLGISTGTTKLLAEALGNRSHKRIDAILSASFRTTGLSALLFTILLFLTADFVGNFLGRETIVPYLKMASLWIIPYSFMKNSFAVIDGFQEMKYSFLGGLFREPLRLAALGIVILVGISIDRIILGWTIAIYLIFLFLTLLLGKFLSQRGWKLRLLSENKEEGFMKYSLYLYLPYIGVWVLPFLLNAFIGKFGTLSEVSLFAVAFSLTTLPYFLFLPLSGALLPAVSETYGNGLDVKPITLLFTYVGIINFILLSILCFWRSFILTFLYGKEYQMAQTFLVILSFAVFFESFKIVADPLLKGTHYARVSMFIEIIRFGVILTGGIVLIHIWSALGAGIAILIVYFFSSFLKLYFVKKFLDIPCLSIFYYSFSWVLLLLVSLLLQIPFPLFLVLTFLVWIIERVISWKELNALWVFLRMRF